MGFEDIKTPNSAHSCQNPIDLIQLLLITFCEPAYCMLLIRDQAVVGFLHHFFNPHLRVPFIGHCFYVLALISPLLNRLSFVLLAGSSAFAFMGDNSTPSQR